jgi:2-dehydropantoate 2-reductase
MGALYGAKLLRENPGSVYFLADGSRHARLSRHGLTVNGRRHPVTVRRPDEGAEPADLVLVAVKHNDLPGAVADMRGQIGEGTLIVSVMNGIDSEEIIAASYGWERVLYAVAVGMDAVRDESGVTYSREGTLFLGEARNDPPSGKVERVRSILGGAGIDVQVPQDMLRVMWWKFMINVGVNQVSAVLRASYGVFQEVPEAMELVEPAMREVLALARASAINLGESDLQECARVLSTLSPEGRTSMCQDISAGRKTEVEMFGGKVSELGDAYRIATPVNDMLYRFIRVLEKMSGQ